MKAEHLILLSKKIDKLEEGVDKLEKDIYEIMKITKKYKREKVINFHVIQ